MNFEVVQMLIERDASLNIRNRIGQTPLDVFGNKDTEIQTIYFKRMLEECSLNQPDNDLLVAKIKEIEMQKVASLLRKKWVDTQNNVLVDKERLKAFHKKINEKTNEKQENLLTLPEKLDRSVDKILNYSDSSQVNLSDMSNDDSEIFPYAEYENFLYDVPVDVFYNVHLLE